MRRHLSTVHDDKKPFKCSKCPSYYSRHRDLKSHVSIEHEGKNPLVNVECSKCSKTYSSQRHLEQHMARVHEPKKCSKSVEKFLGKRVECEICKKFVSSTNLKHHIRSVHEGYKPFQCPKCPVTFSRKGKFKIHVDVVHKDEQVSESSECANMSKPDQAQWAQIT